MLLRAGHQLARQAFAGSSLNNFASIARRYPMLFRSTPATSGRKIKHHGSDCQDGFPAPVLLDSERNTLHLVQRTLHRNFLLAPS